MSTKSQDKSARKPRQRSRKADQRSPKPDQQQNAKHDPRDEDRMAASANGPTNRAAAPEEFPSSGASLAEVPLISEVAPAGAPSIVAVAPADDHAVSIQTIADAYRDYAKRSFQETGSFVEKLVGVQSFDKAIEVQAEFARQAFTSFVLESQKICELYNELAKQIFWPRESFAARMT
jgi:hypothetical protein